MMFDANLIGSIFSTSVRAGNGIQAQPVAHPPKKLLRLFDIENCADCRLVREVLTELNIDAEIYPCPKGGDRYIPKLIELGGQIERPFLHDPNTGIGYYGSNRIIAYLYESYAKRRLPLKWRKAGAVQNLSSSLASLPGAGHEIQIASAKEPRKKLELYSFESSPFARLVREKLCDMEIAYIVRQCGRTTAAEWVPPPVREKLGMTLEPELPNRRYLLENTGRMAIPYLYDPNTGTGLFESRAIIDYLDKTYGG